MTRVLILAVLALSGCETFLKDCDTEWCDRYDTNSRADHIFPSVNAPPADTPAPAEPPSPPAPTDPPAPPGGMMGGGSD